jgi:hypothetical protein
MKKAIRDALYPLSYASNVFMTPYITGVEFYGNNLPNNESSILFLQKNYSHSSANTPFQTYPIIQTGEYYVSFRLFEDAEWAYFSMDGEIITDFSDLKANKWYDFFECPVNLYLMGERQLTVNYNWPRSEDSDNNAIDITYIGSNVETRAKSIKLGQSYCEKI